MEGEKEGERAQVGRKSFLFRLTKYGEAAARVTESVLTRGRGRQALAAKGGRRFRLLLQTSGCRMRDFSNVEAGAVAGLPWDYLG
jgi:hypothetical protein